MILPNTFLIETKPHGYNRYRDIGDYLETQNGFWHITVSDLKDADMNFLIMVHELLELYLTQRRGIKEKDISKFDKEFVKDVKNDGKEAGFDKECPYLLEHSFATKIEKLLARELKVNWDKYYKTINEL